MKPKWWPENPYPESIFPMTDDEYVKAIPNPKLRTAISGYLGRSFWNIASESIRDAMDETIKEPVKKNEDQEELTRLEKAIIETHKPQGDEANWYLAIASACECKQKKGVSAGICRLINSICDYGKCPIRMQILWYFKK